MVPRKRLYVGGALLFAVVVVTGFLIIWELPFFRNSIWTLIFGKFGSGGGGGLPWPLLIFAALMLALLGRPGAMRRAARSEEVSYRLGAESWLARNRVWSCVRFGFAHIWNIVIPFAFVVSLMAVGAYLMVIYLQTYRSSHDSSLALETATDAHVAYNQTWLVFVALTIAGVAIQAGVS